MEPKIVAIIVFCSIIGFLLLIGIVYFIIDYIHTRFLKNNSISLQKLLEINSKYKYNFYKVFDYKDAHTYDNENFYNSISCLDYLVYQLQYKHDAIKTMIQYANLNRETYSKYKREIEQILEYGKYSIEPKHLIEKYLLYKEKKLLKKHTPNPKTEIFAHITLYYAKMNGTICRKKSQSFASEIIERLIERLKDKKGHFFNDRGIWDSICRVERGKVSNRMRFSIYKRDGYRCRICGRSGKFADLEIDHIKPIAKGGKSTYNNLQTLCTRCNKMKGDKY